MVKLQKNNKQYTITIPKDIVCLVKWEAKDKITVTTDTENKDVILKKQ